MYPVRVLAMSEKILRRIFSVFGTLVLCGCVSTSIVSVPYDPLSQARVRAIKGSAIALYSGKECSSSTVLGPGDGGVSATGGMFSSLGGNESIGMPLLKETPSRFMEQTVQANVILTVDAYYSSQAGSSVSWCGPIVGSFVPLPGKDYEVMMEPVGRQCRLAVREIVVSDSGPQYIRIPYVTSTRCKS